MPKLSPGGARGALQGLEGEKVTILQGDVLDRLREIRERVKSAAPGPWHCSGPVTRGGFTFGENAIIGPRGNVVVGWNGFDSADGRLAQKRRNADFIAHARTDILWLLEFVENRTAQKRPAFRKGA